MYAIRRLIERPRPGQRRKLDGRQEAHFAIACSDEGHTTDAATACRQGGRWGLPRASPCPTMMVHKRPGRPYTRSRAPVTSESERQVASRHVEGDRASHCCGLRTSRWLADEAYPHTKTIRLAGQPQHSQAPFVMYDVFEPAEDRQAPRVPQTQLAMSLSVFSNRVH